MMPSERSETRDFTATSRGLILLFSLERSALIALQSTVTYHLVNVFSWTLTHCFSNSTIAAYQFVEVAVGEVRVLVCWYIDIFASLNMQGSKAVVSSHMDIGAVYINRMQTFASRTRDVTGCRQSLHKQRQLTGNHAPSHPGVPSCFKSAAAHLSACALSCKGPKFYRSPVGAQNTNY